MPKLKAIFFPSDDGSVVSHVNTVNSKITGGLGVKYTWTVDELAALATFNTKIPTDLNAADLGMQAAQGLNNTKDTRINDCKLFLNKKGRDMQGHAAFDRADLEACGMFVNHVPPDPNTAKPVISKTTVLPDQVIFDWIRSVWGGIVIWVSFDGNAWTQIPLPDLKSPWEDTRKNQVAGVAETRHYRFRYINKNGEQIGLFTTMKLVVDIE